MYERNAVNPSTPRWRVLLVVAVLLLSVAGCARGPNSESGVHKIGLVYTAPHEAINQIITGFKNSLADEFPADTFEIIERHASGDETQFSSAVNGVLMRSPDILVTITTPISQIALKNKPAATPMVFLAITDPIGAGLVDSIARPIRCTGVSDLAPFEAILRFIRQTRPSAKKIGLPFSPEEQPAVFGRDQVLKLAPRLGFTVDARPVTSQDELSSVVNALAASSDVLLIGSDNGMFEAAPLIVRAALDVNKPVFAGDSTSIKAGAVGGYTIHYPQVGKEGAKLVARVLRGEAPGAIPVVVIREGVLELNRDTSARLGITFPPEIVAHASQIYPK